MPTQEIEQKTQPREMWDSIRAAEYLALDDSTVRDLARRKLLPGRRVGKRWRFYRDELENLPVE